MQTSFTSVIMEGSEIFIYPAIEIKKSETISLIDWCQIITLFLCHVVRGGTLCLFHIVRFSNEPFAHRFGGREKLFT